MRAGKLDRSIEIRTVSHGVPDEYGNVAEGGTVVTTTARAQIVQQSTDEFLASHGETSSFGVIFRIRWLAGITTDHRVIYDGKSLNIREVKEIGRRKGLELRCEEVRT